MSNTFNRKLVDGEVALQLLQGLKDKIDISKVNASRVEGVLDISNIPQSALPTLKVVQNDTERFKLTSRDVKKGDTVKVIETNKLYLVTNMDRLSSEEGYTEYAQTVNWDTIKGRPETFAPSEHTQSTSTINSLQGYVKGDNTSALSTEDTLNVALGKLESIIGLKLNRNIPELKGSEKDVVESINKNVGQFIKGQVDNIDQITENGWYLCNSNCVGAPATFEGIVMNFNGGEGTSVKIWYSVTQESMYIKQTFPGVVKQEWTKVITKADVDNVKQELVQAMANKQNKRDETLLTSDKEITGAINELHGNKQDKNDGRLETSAKDIVEAINEVNKGKADKVHTHNDLYNTKEEILSALAKKEDTIVKNNAFNKSFGITSGTVLEGDKYEDLLSTFESGQSRLEGVIQKKLDLSGGTIEGTLTVNGSLITKNNVGVQCKDNSGSPRTVVQVDTNNNIRLGDTTTPIIIDSDNVSLKGGNTLWTSGNFTPSEKQNANDLSLQTSAKNITGAINEVLTKTNEVSSNLSTKAPLEHIHDDRYTTTVVLDVRLSEIESNVATKEPVIKDKKTAFNKDFGTSVGTVLEGKHLSVLEGKINEKQSKNDSSLQTSSKNIVGAINEIKTNTLGSTGGKINGAINSIEHNGAGNYNIVASDERTVHGTLYGRVASSDGVGEVGLYNKKSEVGIRLKDNGTVLIDSKTLNTTSKEMTGAINELVNKKFDKTGGDLIGNGEILRIKNTDSRGSAYISFYNGGTKKGWIGRGSSGIDSIAMHNQYSGKGLTLRHDGGTQIDALNLNTRTKEVISAINELNLGKLNIDGTNKMNGTLEFSHGTDVRPNIKFLSSDGSLHGALNSRSGDVDKDVYLENNVSGNGIYFKDNGEVKLSSKTIMNISAKTSMRISAPNLETNSKEVIGAINELRKAKSSPSSLDTNVDLNEITATGFYLLNASEHTATNIPTKAKGQGFFLIVMRTGGSFVVQELTLYKTGERFLRAGNISSLPTWKELANEVYLDKKFDKNGGTINGSITVNEFIKTNVVSASAIQAVRGNYTAMMGCSSTVGDFVFGGKPNSKGDYESYIRIANNKCRYHNTSGEYDIITSQGGHTIYGNLTIGTNSNKGKARVVGTDSTLALVTPKNEANYISFVKNNDTSSVRKSFIGFGGVNDKTLTIKNDENGGYLQLLDGAMATNQTIKSTKDDWLGVTAERNGYQAIMGCSGTRGEFLFGGKPSQDVAWNNYIRISPSKLQYTKDSSHTYDIYHSGNFNPASKFNGGKIINKAQWEDFGLAEGIYDYRDYSTAPVGLPASFYNIINIGKYESGGNPGGRTQIAFNYSYSEAKEMYFRTQKNSAGGQQPWNKVFHSGNFNPDTKLNTSGGTINGILTINNNANDHIKLNHGSSHGEIFCTPEGMVFWRSNSHSIGLKGDGEVYIKGKTLKFNESTVYTSGNFDPNTKLNLSGGTMAGDLYMSNGKRFMGYHNYGYMCGADSSNTQKYALYGYNNVLNLGYSGWNNIQVNNPIKSSHDISAPSITINGWKLTIS